MVFISQLRQGLSQRQLNMIAIGGVIGAGLFIGSGVVINSAGPAAFLTYAACGALVILVMRMLGEMASANPSTGSFADYARKALGDWAGFSAGWLYWYFSVIVVGFEAVAGGKVITYWFGAPTWLAALILMVTMTATNLFSVASFGEFEFWFAVIKVSSIVVFLGLGATFVLGLWPGHNMDFHNLSVHGGFMPNGLSGVFAAVVVVMFSMMGAEIATIAAAETPDPQRAVRRATNTVIVRIAIFFVGSVFLLVVILPWTSGELGASPYVAALKEMRIPGADHIMNTVVLVAVFSCLNSSLYTASRMLFVLAAQQEAPSRLARLSSRGVPHLAVLLSSVVGFAGVVMARAAPDTAFIFLLNSSGAVVLFVYLLISLSQIVLRHRTPPEMLRVKMWFFPLLSFLALTGIIAVLVQMALDDAARSQLWFGLVSWGVVILLYLAVKRWRGSGGTLDEPQPAQRESMLVLAATEPLSMVEVYHELRRGDAPPRLGVHFSPVPQGR